MALLQSSPDILACLGKVTSPKGGAKKATRHPSLLIVLRAIRASGRRRQLPPSAAPGP